MDPQYEGDCGVVGVFKVNMILWSRWSLQGEYDSVHNVMFLLGLKR